MEKIKTSLRLLLPSVICVFIIYLTSMSIEYYPLSFGIVIGLFNWKHHKYNSFLGVILSVLVSYIAFFVAFFSGEIINILMSFIFDSINYSKSNEKRGLIVLTITAFILAPLLIFFLYRFVFEITKTKLTFLVIFFSVVILVLLNHYFYSSLISKDVLKHEILNPYTIWQIIMALSLQLILYQKELKKNL